MKVEKAMSCLWGFLLSFVIAFSGACCLITAMNMAVNMGMVALVCGIAAMLCSVFFTLPLWAVPFGLFGLLGGYLWQRGELIPGIESLLFRISRQYDRAYGWGVVRWSVRTSDDMEATLLVGICVVAVLVVLAVAWSVCRRKTAWPGIVLGSLPLLACMVVTDTVPDLIWLFLLLSGVIILVMSSTVRKQDEKQGNRTCVLVTLPVALLLLVLFAVSPPNTYTNQNAKNMVDAVLRNEVMDQLFGRYFKDQGTSGSSVDAGVVRLDAVGYRLSSSAEILRISANFDGTVYLRGRALDTYDGKTWTDSNTDVSALYWPDESLMESRGELVITTQYAHRMLYLPYYTQSKVLEGVSRSLENEKKLKMYSLACSDVPLSQYVEQYPGLTDQPDWGVDPQSYIHLTDSVLKWAKPLVKEIVGAIQNPYYQAQAIGEYVQNSAAYDLRTGKMPGSAKDFARWFLNNSETGYCVHFATAATVLLQAAGIPARYVTGYATEAVNAQITVVRSSDAHAWVEYWLPGYGWAVLEATPTAVLPENTEGAEVTIPETEAAPTQPDAQDATQPTPGQTSQQGGSASPEKTALNLGQLWKILQILGIVLGVLAAVMIQRRVRWCLREKRLIQGTPNQRAIANWQELVRLCRVLGQLPEESLLHLAQKAKFSQHTVSPEELAQLETGVLVARNKLRSRSVFHRFWYRVVLVLY